MVLKKQISLFVDADAVIATSLKHRPAHQAALREKIAPSDQR
jgi:hypothetical protein